MDIPSKLSDKLEPLPIDQLDGRSQEAAIKLGSQGYEVMVGLTPEYAQQIMKMCQEPAIREYCPMDSIKRFKDLEATEQWLAKKPRAIFLLLKKTDNGLVLAGYAWTGRSTSEQVPGGQTTFALRVGEIGHGQGLAAPFSWLTITASAKLYDIADFWLETWESNGAAVHIYHKLGFEDVAKMPGQRKRLDSEPVDDTRIYMRLPSISAK